MKKLFLLARGPSIFFIALTILLPVMTSNASSNSATVSIIGDEGFNANSRIFSTFRFSPGLTEINHGGVITFENLVTNEGHTISIVAASALPANITQVFMCGAPGTVCAAVAAAHFPNGFGPNGQPNPGPVLFFVNVPGNPPGFAQGNVQGNSLIIRPGQTVDLTVSAPSGTSFHFMCVIHPWMQARVDVK